MVMRRQWLVTVAAVLGVLVTARLGWWQMSRAEQKQALQASIDERGRWPLLGMSDLARDQATASGQHHRLVKLQGRWLPQYTVYLDNRQMEARVGFYVLTPLQLPTGDAVLVQRGWVARDFLNREAVPTVPSPPGEVTVMGRIAPAPGQLYALGQETTGRIRQNLDIGSFARETGLVLRPLSVLQQDLPLVGPEAPSATGSVPSSPDGLLRRWPAPSANLGKHHGYAFQWFALSALIAGLYVWFQILRPRRQPSGLQHHVG